MRSSASSMQRGRAMPERILLVEDTTSIAEPLAAVLRLEGWDVEATASGLDALLRAASAPPSLMLLDLDVADLSGMGVQRALRDLSDVPVVVMSASHDGWIDEAFAHGATACMRKPFDATDVVTLVRETLRAARSPHAGQGGFGAGWSADVRRLSPRDLARVADLAPQQLDSLPFGAMRVDAQGRITSFNAYEGRASRNAHEDVVGRRFADLAPCVMVRGFAERIAEGVARGALDEELHFVFPYYGAQCVASVRLWLDPGSREVWLFTSMRPGGAPEVRTSRASRPSRPAAQAERVSAEPPPP